MKQILYLSTYIGEDCFFQEKRNEHPNVKNYDLISPKYAFNKVLIGTGYYICPRFSYFLYDEWKREIDNYKVVIMDSRRASKFAVQWIKKKHPKIRVIVWYWNRVSAKELDPNFCKQHGCEVWSFDKTDCEKYDMHFNDQYLLVSDMDTAITSGIDLTYVGGWSKEREKQLTKIISKFEDIKGYYQLAHNQREWIPYEKYIGLVKKSKGILEINKEGQSGLTLRALEALFYRKKLITNNISIRNEGIYNQDNIYVIGVDDKPVKEFLNEPYCMPENYDDLVSYYSFDSWIKRIYEFGSV